MNWYYVDAGQQAGPVDDTKLAELARSGKIQADTLVWHEGMPNWTRYAEAAPAPTAGMPPVTASPAGAGSGGMTCSQCGRTFAPDEVIRYGDKWVCATCKPIFFQRLSEGATLPAAGPAASASEADLLARDYEVDIGGSLSRAWEVFKADAGLIIGASVMVYMAILATNVVPYTAANVVPHVATNVVRYLGTVLAALLVGPLVGGLWLFYLKKMRNQEAALGDAFGGFGPKLWQLGLVQLIPTTISTGFLILIKVVAARTVPALTVPAILQFLLHGDGDLTGIAPMTLIPVGVLVLGFAVVMSYLTTCWLFALPLVGDKGLQFWPALQLSRRVVSKHWWMTFGLVLVYSIIKIAGEFACCVGVLVSAPLAFAMIVVHYQKVFGDLAPAQNPG